MSIQGLTIGKVARKSGVNVETVRYYQRMGLIQEPDKPAQGYRNYAEEHINQIRFIKRAQLLGFSLREIQEIMQLHNCVTEQMNSIIKQKLREIEVRIQDLESIRQVLTEYQKDSTIKENNESILEVFA